MVVQAAARFLGIPDTWPERRAGNQRLPIAPFLNDREIELLANRISDTTCTTDYRHRRISLATWTLPQTHWATIWGQVTPRSGTTPPHDSPRKHQAASEFVWSRVTGSERALAPVIPGLPPQLRHRRHWGSIAGCLAGPGANTHYAQLNPLLTEYADRLAIAVDQRQPHALGGASSQEPSAGQSL
ncbi:hypothetical protein OH809_35710 [Streptomyces sp. NBC_00873]|uniref:hypothetical protein n=1 Tax=unclassified Streptomyces TaxID=2593676 RepID=UPI003865299B|nr:hypothetical protein OH809_35710 [Streptomyces sp. NBC_00873]WTA42555.1 hypothetical protein OH821_08000 [Streptomyces sp. NBC_00842]